MEDAAAREAGASTGEFVFPDGGGGALLMDDERSFNAAACAAADLFVELVNAFVKGSLLENEVK